MEMRKNLDYFTTKTIFFIHKLLKLDLADKKSTNFFVSTKETDYNRMFLTAVTLMVKVINEFILRTILEGDSGSGVVMYVKSNGDMDESPNPVLVGVADFIINETPR